MLVQFSGQGMLGAQELRIAYAASDLFVSASTCETLGNTVVEAFGLEMHVTRMVAVTYGGMELWYPSCDSAGRRSFGVCQGPDRIVILRQLAHALFHQDNENSYLVDFDDSNLAREHLASIVAGGEACARS